MKRFLTFVGLAVLLAGLVLPIPSVAVAQAPASQTYTVLVGLENAKQGVGVMAFFPANVVIHAGDTVHWKINSNEIHTVSFGYEQGAELPPFVVPAAALGYPSDPSPLIANPAATNPVVPAGGE
jgi:plastocyanin